MKQMLGLVMVAFVVIASAILGALSTYAFTNLKGHE